MASTTWLVAGKARQGAAHARKRPRRDRAAAPTPPRSPAQGKKQHSVCAAYSGRRLTLGNKAKPTRRLPAHKQLHLAAWNMSYLSKIQVQFLDLLGHDIVFLSEVHDSAMLLADYGGVHRLLPSGTPSSDDLAGSCAFYITAPIAKSTCNWNNMLDTGWQRAQHGWAPAVYRGHVPAH